MRAVFLALIAAMAACSPSVSCSVLVPSPGSVSVGCFNTSVALSTAPAVSLAESYITESGCTKLDYDITDVEREGSPCTQDSGTGAYKCDCLTTLSNTTSWVYAVGNISSGLTCYLSYTVSLTGIKTSNNRTRYLSGVRTNYEVLAMGGSCNTTEIESGLKSELSSLLANLEYSTVNANSNVSGVIWNYATITISAFCNGILSRDIPASKNITINTIGSGSSSSSSSSSSGSSSSSNSNSNSTSSVPTGTPAPSSNSSSSSSSSSSSTGGGNPTGTAPGNGASSVMMHSATAVMVALISAAAGAAAIRAA